MKKTILASTLAFGIIAMAGSALANPGSNKYANYIEEKTTLGTMFPAGNFTEASGDYKDRDEYQRGAFVYTFERPTGPKNYQNNATQQ